MSGQLGVQPREITSRMVELAERVNDPRRSYVERLLAAQLLAFHVSPLFRGEPYLFDATLRAHEGEKDV